MDEFIFVGKIVSTHGIKGELKVISDEDLKESIFKVNNNLYIGKDKRKINIISSRLHKNYVLVKLDGYEDINLVDDLLNELVFVKKEELNLGNNEYLYYELLECQIIENNKEYGYVFEIQKGKKVNYIKVKYEDKEYFIPLIAEYIESVDTTNKKIFTKNVESLII